MNTRILVVDDEDLVIKSVKRLLEKEGFEVLIAANGDQAIEIVKSEPVDLILSDVRMPGKDGVETAREIKHVRDQRGLSPIPIIFLTGYANEELEHQEHGLRPVACIYKPFDAPKLIEIIRSAASTSVV